MASYLTRNTLSRWTDERYRQVLGVPVHTPWAGHQLDPGSLAPVTTLTGQEYTKDEINEFFLRQITELIEFKNQHS